MLIINYISIPIPRKGQGNALPNFRG